MASLTLEQASVRFTKKFKKSGQLNELGSQYISGGYSRNSLTFGPHTIYTESGDEQFLFFKKGI